MKLKNEVGKRKLRNKFRRAKGVVQDNQEEAYREPCRLGIELDWLGISQAKTASSCEKARAAPCAERNS